jgi:hypothetical protein
MVVQLNSVASCVSSYMMDKTLGDVDTWIKQHLFFAKKSADLGYAIQPASRQDAKGFVKADKPLGANPRGGCARDSVHLCHSL